MENTEINRTMFFAQYLFQPILIAKISGLQLVLNTTSLNDYYDGDYLELKPLSLITDEDAKETGFGTSSHFNNALNRNGYEGFVTQVLSSYDTDYLRSKGYALPYMGLSVEKQIEYGWVKFNQTR